MQFPTYDEALNRAAETWGIQPDYWDIWGRQHFTPPETKRAILKSLGVDAETREGVERALCERAREEWSRLVPPCLVVGQNHAPGEFTAYLPAEIGDLDARVTVKREDGAAEVYQIALGGLPAAASAEFDGRQFLSKALPLPANLPLGYHDLELRVGGACASMRLIVAPDRAYLPEGLRAAGIAIALYGVRSERNWGCGDFRDLEGFIDWIADEVGASFVALNPLHAIHNRRPYNTSPYLPNSVFYQNFLYLDVESIPDFSESPRVRRLWAKPEVQREVAALRASESVEYERVHVLKIGFLKLMFAWFLHKHGSGSSRARQFQEYIQREGALLGRFAVYCALDEWMHRRNPGVWVWPEWPAPFQDPDSDETRAFQRKHWRSVLFYQYLQWQIDLQLARVQQHARDKGLSIGLYHDLALATDRYGSDLWAHRSYFATGCRVGSPPDDFSPRGQDWAFPPPNSARHRASGYRLFVESIRKNCRHGGALRIDHAMRFFRLYWIPDGVDATSGAYMRENWEDLVRIVALESVRQRVVVIGEDLGTVEPEVRKTLAHFGILSYRLLYFEKDRSGQFRERSEYPRQALVSSTTHDLPTLAGFWLGEDIEARRRAGVLSDEASYREQLRVRGLEKQKMLDALLREGLLPPWFPKSALEIPELSGELHNAVIGFLASTPSMLLLINQEDLTKEVAQQNLPGTTWQYPNWSRKMHFRLEELYSAKQATDFVQMFRSWIEKSGRTNPPILSEQA
jgi:4-alpha-glucanotransferase